VDQSRDWKAPGFVAHYNALYALSEAEVRGYVERLDLRGTDVLVDFGCGDGFFLALAAPRVSRAVGVDSSPRQVELARRRLGQFSHVEVVSTTFLEFDAAGRTFTKAFSRKALHHLTDPDKERFLMRLAPNFAPGAVFLLEDAMFPFDRKDLDSRLPQVLKEAAAYFGPDWEAKRGDILHSLREEFPTGQDFWAEAFRKAGFCVAERWQRTCFLGGLLARKEG